MAYQQYLDNKQIQFDIAQRDALDEQFLYYYDVLADEFQEENENGEMASKDTGKLEAVIEVNESEPEMFLQNVDEIV